MSGMDRATPFFAEQGAVDQGNGMIRMGTAVEDKEVLVILCCIWKWKEESAILLEIENICAHETKNQTFIKKELYPDV